MHHISMQDLVASRDKFMWVLYPLNSEGLENHTVTLVDDLVFDSTINKALKRDMTTIKRIFRDDELKVRARHYTYPLKLVADRQKFQAYNRT